MKKIKIINTANFNYGKLQLTEVQAKSRAHLLKQIKNDIYEILKPVQFKAGEEVGYDGEINKLLMLDIEDVNAKKEDSRNLLAEDEAGAIEDAADKRIQKIRKKNKK